MHSPISDGGYAGLLRNIGKILAAIGTCAQGSFRAGITIIHINTEIRIAWRQGIETALAKQPGEIAPYKLLPAALEG